MGRTVIAGGSIAGVSAVRSLRALGCDDELVLLDADERVPYRRPGVSKGLITGAGSADELALPWDENWDCRRMLGARAVSLDLPSRRLRVSERGHTSDLSFDRLLIATGSEARRPRTLAGGDVVLTVRTVADGLRISELAGKHTRAVIVGAGFLGLELASSLRTRGLDVTVVEAAGAVLGGRFAAPITDRVTQLHHDHGVPIRLGGGVQSFVHSAGVVSGVELSDGARIDDALVVWATGGAPTVGWLGSALGKVDNGIACDELGRVEGTSEIYALGDVAAWQHSRYGQRLRIEHWTNAMDQASVVAKAIADPAGAEGLRSLPYVWSDQYDHKFQVLGLPWLADRVEPLPGDSDGDVVLGHFAGERLVSVVGLTRLGKTVMAYRKRVAEESWLGGAHALVAG